MCWNSSSSKCLVTTWTLPALLLLLANGMHLSTAQSRSKKEAVPPDGTTKYVPCQLSEQDFGLVESHLQTLLAVLNADPSILDKNPTDPSREPCKRDYVTELTTSVRLVTTRFAKLMSTATKTSCKERQAAVKDSALLKLGVKKLREMLTGITLTSTDTLGRPLGLALDTQKLYHLIKQELKVIVRVPVLAVDPPEALVEMIKALNMSYPACRKPFDLVDADRLELIYSTFDLSVPLVSEALFEVITTPSPLICTQDYVRLAANVMKQDRSCDAGPWGLLWSKFNPGVFRLLNSSVVEAKIKSVEKPGFALFATDTKIPGFHWKNRHAVLAKQVPEGTSDEAAFQFSFLPQNDARYFFIKNAAHGSYLEETHMYRVDDEENIDGMMLLPSQESVKDIGHRMEFQLRSRGLKFPVGVVPISESLKEVVAGGSDDKEVFMLDFERGQDKKSTLFYLDD